MFEKLATFSAPPTGTPRIGVIGFHASTKDAKLVLAQYKRCWHRSLEIFAIFIPLAHAMWLLHVVLSRGLCSLACCMHTTPPHAEIRHAPASTSEPQLVVCVMHLAGVWASSRTGRGHGVVGGGSPHNMAFFLDFPGLVLQIEFA